jgi:uncharacterized membrane protein YraQ (UPF0718 family)
MNLKLRDITEYFFLNLVKSLFLVGAGIFFAISLSAYISHEIVNDLCRKISEPVLIMYASLIGLAAPGPRYIIYPILSRLRDFGVGTGVMVALISGHVLMEPSTFLMEIGFLGFRFPVKRLLVAFFVSFVSGIFAMFILGGA